MFSIVEYLGRDDETNECGYCKQKGGLNHGMWAHELSCESYEDLMYRGWRRSGKYCYKPIMNETCCPQYPIRCDVTQFKLSKSQKKVLRKMKKFLTSGERQNTTRNEVEEHRINNEMSNVKEIPIQYHGTQSKPKKYVDGVENRQRSVENINKDVNPSVCHASNVNNEKASIEPKPHQRSELAPSKKKKDIRREKFAKKVGKSVEEIVNDNKTKQPQQKSLSEYIEETTTGKHKLSVKLVQVNPQSEEFKSTYHLEYEIYKSYQIQIHGDSPDEVTEKQFQRFLINGPLEAEYATSSNNLPQSGLGSFHQQYYIDGRLIAVGVLDILPSCISSKYLFYDPEYSFLSLGTYSALREIYFTQQLQKQCSKLKYYCMGFYVHSCPKMRYKGQFSASYLLCPEAYTWHLVDTCKSKLDVNKYSRLEDDLTIRAEEADIDRVLILFNGQIFPYSLWSSIIHRNDKDTQDSLVREYTHLAGYTAHKILLYRDVSVLTSPCALVTL